MKTPCAVTLAMCSRAAHSARWRLRASTLKPEAAHLLCRGESVDTSDSDAYAKEFAPQAQAIIKAAGGRFVAIGGVRGNGSKSELLRL